MDPITLLNEAFQFLSDCVDNGDLDAGLAIDENGRKLENLILDMQKALGGC